MSDAPLKATLKAGGGYDAPWLTVDGRDVAELEQQLQAVISGNVPQLLIEAANVVKAAHNAGPILPQGQEAAQAPVGAPSQAPAPQNNGWGNQQQAPAPQQAAQQRQFGGPPHPEGKQCEFPGCGKVLEFKKTSTGKGTWRCPDWRWGNGNPNGHSQLWAD